MGLLDFICNFSEALDKYRNFSCRNQNLEGFKRCYDYVSGDTYYYDDGHEDSKKVEANLPSNITKRSDYQEKLTCMKCGSELYDLHGDPNWDYICVKCGQKYWNSAGI